MGGERQQRLAECGDHARVEIVPEQLIRRVRPGRIDIGLAQEALALVGAVADHRLALATLAFAEVAGAEVALDPHARTVDSLEELALTDPVFLVGADEFASFLSWKQPERVLELARLGVATRPGTARERLDAVLAAVDRPDRVAFFEIPRHDVSSSGIRRRVAAGESIDGLVAPAVAAEIARLGLYRGTVAATMGWVDSVQDTGEDATA